VPDYPLPPDGYKRLYLDWAWFEPIALVEGPPISVPSNGDDAWRVANVGVTTRGERRMAYVDLLPCEAKEGADG